MKALAIPHGPPTLMNKMISRRHFLSSIAASMGMWAISNRLWAENQPDRTIQQPNILLMVADDLTYHDLGCTGNQDVRTPHLDKLASEGMLLTHCFTPTAMCVPARASLYTGLFPVRHGAYPNQSHVYDDTTGLPVYFNNLGYQTGIVGKIHVKPAHCFPFKFIGATPGGHRITDTTVDGIVEAAEKFIKASRDTTWCLVVAANEPHAPWPPNHPPKPVLERLTVPKYLLDTLQTRADLYDYYQQIQRLDAKIGEILAALEAANQRDNTLVMFVSEHGAGVPFAKWTLYDAGIRAAMIVRWPGHIRPGSKSNALIQYPDVLPTLLEATHAPVPAKLDGQSFVGVLLGQTPHHRDYIYGIHTSRGSTVGPDMFAIRCVRDRRWKYILNLNADKPFRGGDIHSDMFKSWQNEAKSRPHYNKRIDQYIHRPREELYDLENDPFELHNLAENPNLRGEMNRLRKKLSNWMAQQSDLGIATEVKALDRIDEKRLERREKRMHQQVNKRNNSL